MNCTLRLFAGCTACWGLWAGSAAAAVTDLVTEDFTSSSANWANFNSSAALNYLATGGPDNGAYASGPRSFQGLTPGNATVILRARSDFPWHSSNDAFFFDWAHNGVGRVSAYVRHDVPEPLSFFVRAAGPMGFPGGSYKSLGLVPAGVWTKLSFDISPASPQLAAADALEGSTWGGVFSSIGFLQFGVFVPTGHVSDATSFKFDLDKVTVSTPEPATVVLALVGLGGGLLIARRSQQRRNRQQAGETQGWRG